MRANTPILGPPEGRVGLFGYPNPREGRRCALWRVSEGRDFRARKREKPRTRRGSFMGRRGSLAARPGSKQSGKHKSGGVARGAE